MELSPPVASGGHWVAGDRHRTAEVRFVGHGPVTDRAALLTVVGGEGLELAWCRQVHSDRALEATPGECGEADALTTREVGLALAVATADCVPVIVAGEERLAAIHAGWRGIAARIVPKTLDRMRTSDELTAWLGPAIGSCCYEVGRDVADAVVAASGSQAEIVSDDPTKPHLHLHRAITLQLERCGLTDIRRVDLCTRCHPETASYRRDGQRAKRNLTFAWLRP